MLKLEDSPSEENTNYLLNLKQLADIFPRDSRYTDYKPIKKLCYKVVNQKVFAITVSQNNKADLYSNMAHKQYIDHTVNDAEMSMLSFFLKLDETQEDDDQIGESNLKQS